MTTPTVAELVPNGHPLGHRIEVGERVELGRYAISAGERVIYGRRVAGVVRFLPEEPVVVACAWADSDDGICRSRCRMVGGGRPNAVRRKRRNDERALDGAPGDHREGSS